MSRVIFSTNCYYKDYEKLNEDLEYRVALNKYCFDEIWVTVLNVPDTEKVKDLFGGRATVFSLEKDAGAALTKLGLDKNSFKDAWGDGYNYSMGPIIELFHADSEDFICHFTSDVALLHAYDWITPGLKLLSSKCAAVRPGYPRYALENEEERTRKKTNVFSDHCYLIGAGEFQDPKVYILTNPKVDNIHPSYAGNSFERRITRYLMATGKYEAIINQTEIIHPVC